MNKVRQILTAAALFVIGLGLASGGITRPDIVRLDTGKVEGEILDAESGLVVFRGIPYAARET